MLKKWLKKWIVLLLSTGFVLSACHSPVYNQSQGNVADVKIRAAAARHKSDMDAKTKPALLVKQGMYVDTTPRSLSRQPSWLQNKIVIRGDQLPFSYYSRTIASGAGQNILTKYQVGLDPAVPISVSYTGSIKGALDLIAAKTGYVYAVFGRQIYWQAFVTRTFDIAFMPGSSDYLMGKTGSGSGSSSSNANSGGGGTVSNYVSSDYSSSEYSNLSGKLSVWTDLENTVHQLLSPDGKATVSQATTSVTVRDRPTNVELVGQYIRNLNKNLSKQVLVKIQVLEVLLNNDYNFGINWQIIASAFNRSPFVVNANYGTPITIQNAIANSGTVGVPPLVGLNAAKDPKTIATGQLGIPSYTILFNALTQQGKTSLVSEPRVVCLNNQVSVVRVVKSQGYAASVQNTSLASGGTAPTSTVTSQITPGTVVTGLTLYILPKILNNKVYLQVNADLSTNDGLKEFVTGAGNNTTKIQLPNITEKHFNQRSMINSGDTLILSGFRQVGNQANAAQFLNSQALGGKGSQQLNTETIVLITPIILSEANV